PGRSYLLEAVVRTVKMGHHFTQGTSDSNEVWLDVTASTGAEVVGRSGGMNEDGGVDPWSFFVNSYVLDRDGDRIDRRNAQDIFVPLYNHNIPPGAAEVVHYRLDVPPDASGSLTVRADLRFRKFDTTYMQYVYGEDHVNDLPVLDLASDTVVFPIAGSASVSTESVISEPSTIPEWQRWNDYGIGLLRKGGKTKGELRQAEAAFQRVEALGKPDGPLNLARVYLAQGTVADKAIEALGRAVEFDPPAPTWSVAWFTGLVNKQNGFLDEAIANFRSIIQLDDAESRRREFEFGQDYRLLNELGQTLFERAKLERRRAAGSGGGRREALLEEARGWFLDVLDLDPENVTAHYNLDLIYKQLGRREEAAHHFALYRKYKPDDNARGRAIAKHRAENPAADHAAEPIAIYDLQRAGAYGLSGGLDGGPVGRPGGGD
ncbi:MAG: tetratricopeptide repeat protein, partial [Thermoanaerobaculia bacterium]